MRASGKSYHDHLRADCCAAGRVARADAGALREEPERRVLVLERVVGASSPDLAAVVDLDMLLITGGRERTAGEWGGLFTAAGFRRALRSGQGRLDSFRMPTGLSVNSPTYVASCTGRPHAVCCPA
ncbi:methyltransferase [Streptomyces sp. NPDC004783]|uniref:methyltransferase n=1 Tax=Streptomyces sp. NPDC004783 TaxID=3154459 RepID=UPI0033AA1546